jgi:tRNA/rRNA methyltransferase
MVTDVIKSEDVHCSADTPRSKPETSDATHGALPIRFVLARPSHPRNIGAVARAMKTMGFADLVLVQPKAFPHPEAVVVANRAADVLDRAQVVPTLAEALSDVEYAYAFASVARDLSHPALPVTPAMQAAAAQAKRSHSVALVFGNETYGLSNAEVMVCNRLVTIPTADDYDSLNLAQAVQVAAFVLAEASRGRPDGHAVNDIEPDTGPKASRPDVEGLVRAIEAAAIASGFLDPAKPKRLVQRLQRLFARADIEPEEVAVLRGIIASLATPPENNRRSVRQLE